MTVIEQLNGSGESATVLVPSHEVRRWSWLYEKRQHSYAYSGYARDPGALQWVPISYLIVLRAGKLLPQYYDTHILPLVQAMVDLFDCSLFDQTPSLPSIWHAIIQYAPSLIAAYDVNDTRGESQLLNYLVASGVPFFHPSSRPGLAPCYVPHAYEHVTQQCVMIGPIDDYLATCVQWLCANGALPFVIDNRPYHISDEELVWRNQLSPGTTVNVHKGK
jgi:hypothetical protein